MKTHEFNEESHESDFYGWHKLPYTYREEKHNKAHARIILLLIFALILLVSFTSCTTAKVNRVYMHHQDNADLRGLCESYFITVEQGNRENNTPNEKDSIKRLIFVNLKSIKSQR